MTAAPRSTRDVLLAVVLGAQGLKGEVKVKTFTAAPDALTRYGALHAKDGRAFRVTALRAGKNSEAVVSLIGVNDRTAAEQLKGTELFIAREALPPADEEEFYHADLIGLRAEDEEGRAIGIVHAIHNFGAGDVIELARADGDTVLLPFNRRVVPTIDLQNSRIVVAVPEDEDEAKKGYVE